MAELNVGQQCDGEKKKKKLGSLLRLAPPGRRRTSASPASPDCHVSAQNPRADEKQREEKKKKNLDDN